MDETLTFRLEAPMPDCTVLQNSINFWNLKLDWLKKEGWKIYAWDEYEGNKKIPVEEGSKKGITDQRIFYAMAYCSKREKDYEEVLCSSELTKEKTHLAEIANACSRN